MPPASRVFAFLLVFTALFLLALAVTIASEFSDVKWIEATVRIGEGLGRLTFVSIATTFIPVEGVPVLAAWFKKQMVNEALEKGREEGRASEREAWQDWRSKLEKWEKRRATAVDEGSTFEEPQPDPPSGD